MKWTKLCGACGHAGTRRLGECRDLCSPGGQRCRQGLRMRTGLSALREQAGHLPARLQEGLHLPAGLLEAGVRFELRTGVRIKRSGQRLRTHRMRPQEGLRIVWQRSLRQQRLCDALCAGCREVRPGRRSWLCRSGSLCFGWFVRPQAGVAGPAVRQTLLRHQHGMRSGCRQVRPRC